MGGAFGFFESERSFDGGIVAPEGGGGELLLGRVSGGDGVEEGVGVVGGFEPQERGAAGDRAVFDQYFGDAKLAAVGVGLVANDAEFVGLVAGVDVKPVVDAAAAGGGGLV